MKQLLLLLLTAGFSAAAFAQTPANKTKSVVFEFSDTWCTPCGAYGVDVADSLKAAMELQGKGYLIGVKTTSTPSSLNAIGGNTMFTNFAVDGIPAFIINNGSVDDGVTHNNAADVERMMKKVSQFDSVDAVGGIAAIASIAGNMLTVTAKSKFWNATTGNYYMSVLLAEDGISATQSSYPSNPAIHANVLRGAMATSGTLLSADPWGESVGTGTITAGQEFIKTFKVGIDTSWNTSKLVAFAVIFKKNTDNTYEVVNVEKAASTATAIGSITSLKEISVYPNPATDMVHIAINASETLTVEARITDAQGKTVYNKKGIVINKGGDELRIRTGNLPAGSYMISLSNDKMGAVTRNIVIR